MKKQYIHPLSKKPYYTITDTNKCGQVESGVFYCKSPTGGLFYSGTMSQCVAKIEQTIAKQCTDWPLPMWEIV